MAKTIFNNLQGLLDEHGITQAQLANAGGLTEKTVNRACNFVQVSGRSRRKIRDGLNKLAAPKKYKLEDIFPNG